MRKRRVYAEPEAPIGVPNSDDFDGWWAVVAIWLALAAGVVALLVWIVRWLS